MFALDPKHAFSIGVKNLSNAGILLELYFEQRSHSVNYNLVVFKPINFIVGNGFDLLS